MTINRHISIICLFFIVQTGWFIALCQKYRKKPKQGGIWPYHTVKYRNTVKSSVVSISVRPGVVYIFGSRFSCQNAGRCYIPTQPIFLHILIQNLPSPYPIPTFHLFPTNHPISTILSSINHSSKPSSKKFPFSLHSGHIILSQNHHFSHIFTHLIDLLSHNFPILFRTPFGNNHF